VHPTQPVEIFGNFSSPFGTLASVDTHGQFYGDRSRGTPTSGGLNARAFGAISWKRCKIGGKLVLITDKKSYMSFRLVPKSVTLNDLERRNSPYFALFYRIW